MAPKTGIAQGASKDTAPKDLISLRNMRNGEVYKFSCKTCINGHRAPYCDPQKHRDKIMYRRPAPGRPARQCGHPKAIQCDCKAKRALCCALNPDQWEDVLQGKIVAVEMYDDEAELEAAQATQVTQTIRQVQPDMMKTEDAAAVFNPFNQFLEHSFEPSFKRQPVQLPTPSPGIQRVQMMDANVWQGDDNVTRGPFDWTGSAAPDPITPESSDNSIHSTPAPYLSGFPAQQSSMASPMPDLGVNSHVPSFNSSWLQETTASSVRSVSRQASMTELPHSEDFITPNSHYMQPPPRDWLVANQADHVRQRSVPIISSQHHLGAPMYHPGAPMYHPPPIFANGPPGTAMATNLALRNQVLSNTPNALPQVAQAVAQHPQTPLSHYPHQMQLQATQTPQPQMPLPHYPHEVQPQATTTTQPPSLYPAYGFPGLAPIDQFPCGNCASAMCTCRNCPTTMQSLERGSAWSQACSRSGHRDNNKNNSNRMPAVAQYTQEQTSHCCHQTQQPTEPELELEPFRDPELRDSLMWGGPAIPDAHNSSMEDFLIRDLANPLMQHNQHWSNLS